MEKKNFNECADEIYEDGYNIGYEEGAVDAIQSVSELCRDAYDVVLDALEGELTLSEKLLIVHAFEVHSEIVDQLIDEDYEIECDGDCEDCPYHKEEELMN